MNAAFAPRLVFLFSGHLVDAPGRPRPRLPADHLGAAATAIARGLDEQGAGPQDLALTQGAAGGDLLFAEAALARGLRLELLLPQAEADFVQTSVRQGDAGAAGTAWAARWAAVRAQAAGLAVQAPGAGDPYERCNAALLARALQAGVQRLRFIALWDGEPGGTGGTGHMVEAVRAAGGAVHWIDTRRLEPQASTPGSAP